MANLRKTEYSTYARFLHAEFMVDDKEIFDLAVMKNDAERQLLPHELVLLGLIDFNMLLIFKFINEINSS
jgi:hypothetical protein